MDIQHVHSTWKPLLLWSSYSPCDARRKSQDPVPTPTSGPKRPSKLRCGSTERTAPQQPLCSSVESYLETSARYEEALNGVHDGSRKDMQALMPCSGKAQLLFAQYPRFSTIRSDLILTEPQRPVINTYVSYQPGIAMPIHRRILRPETRLVSFVADNDHTSTVVAKPIRPCTAVKPKPILC